MNLQLDFNDKEEEFYYKHKKILKNMFERVALVSAKETMNKLKGMLNPKIYKLSMKKIKKELSKLK